MQRTPSGTFSALPARSPLEAGAAPLRLEERRRADFQAEVHWPPGGQPRAARLRDLSASGAFVCWPHGPPPLFTRLHLTLLPPGAPPFALQARVVRVVTEAEAEAWRVPVGLGVQFAAPGPEARARLAQLLRTLGPAPGPESAAGSRPEVAAALEYFRRRAQAGHYEFLGAAPDAGRAQLEGRRLTLEGELDRLARARLAPLEAAQVRAARERLRAACEVLLAPASRLDYDAQRGNFRGVARAVAEGVSRALVQAKRVSFVLDRRGAETRVHLHVGRARLALGARDPAGALAEYEAALALDPLNLELHDAHAELARAGAPGGGRP